MIGNNNLKLYQDVWIDETGLFNILKQDQMLLVIYIRLFIE